MGDWFLLFGTIFASVGFMYVGTILCVKDKSAQRALPGPRCRCGDETVRETDGWLCVWCEEYVGERLALATDVTYAGSPTNLYFGADEKLYRELATPHGITWVEVKLSKSLTGAQLPTRIPSSGRPRSS